MTAKEADMVMEMTTAQQNGNAEGQPNPQVAELEATVATLREQLETARRAINEASEAGLARQERHTAQVENLRGQLAATRQQAETARQQHREDIAAIGEALIAEAQSRRWCEDYDRIIGRLNERLHVELPSRYKEFSVTATITVTFSVDEATDEDDARERAHAILRDVEYTIDNRTTASVSGWEVDDIDED